MQFMGQETLTINLGCLSSSLRDPGRGQSRKDERILPTNGHRRTAAIAWIYPAARPYFAPRYVVATKNSLGGSNKQAT
jgi:hypothetical protein